MAREFPIRISYGRPSGAKRSAPLRGQVQTGRGIGSHSGVDRGWMLVQKGVYAWGLIAARCVHAVGEVCITIRRNADTAHASMS